MIVKGRSDAWFLSILQGADIVTADGVGIQWAASFLTYAREQKRSTVKILIRFVKTLVAVILRPKVIHGPISERISGSDIILNIAKEAAKHHRSVLLIGGKKRTAVRAANVLQNKIPKLVISGYKQDHIATPYPSYDLHITIEQLKPDVIFVGYGSPQQEEWIHQNLHRFPFVRIAMGVGGGLDFLAGNAPRAPIRYQAHGIEWFWRVIHQPNRIFRILHAILYFPFLVLCYAVTKPRQRS